MRGPFWNPQKVGVGHVVSQPLSSGSRIFHHPPKGQNCQDSKPTMLEKVRHDS